MRTLITNYWLIDWLIVDWRFINNTSMHSVEEPTAECGQMNYAQFNGGSNFWRSEHHGLGERRNDGWRHDVTPGWTELAQTKLDDGDNAISLITGNDRRVSARTKSRISGHVMPILLRCRNKEYAFSSSAGTDSLIFISPYNGSKRRRKI